MPLVAPSRIGAVIGAALVAMSLVQAPAADAVVADDPREVYLQQVDRGLELVDRARAQLAEGSISALVRAAGSLGGGSVDAGVPAMPPGAGLRARALQLEDAADRAGGATPFAGASTQPAPVLVSATFDGIHAEFGDSSTQPDEATRRRLVARALVVAEAIDQVLHASGPARQGDVTGKPDKVCDVLDQSPDLCISGEGKHVYEEDYKILIDRGGNDVYRNSAGGADPERNDLDVSVVVDLAGNDKYQAMTPLRGGSRVVQGAAIAGGVGMLVDQAGNDHYAIESRPLLTPPDSSGAVGQGAAITGFGLLADYEGNDTYEVLSKDPGQGAFALGSGATGGLGVLYEAGGDDRYKVEAEPIHILDQDRIPHPRTSFATGVGVGAIGTGLFADAAGKDKVLIEARNGIKGRMDPPDLESASAVAQGVGLGSLGVGVAIFGEGSVDARLVVHNDIPSDNEDAAAVAQAVGLGGGVGLAPGPFGALYDAGGDDSYVAAARSRRSEQSGGSVIVAHGASIGGTGILVEAAGNDRYVAEADAEARRAAGAVAVAQGAGYSGGGVGYIEDRSGADAYTSSTKGVTTEGRNLEGLGAISYAQAAGVTGAGFLRDLAGKDAYASRQIYKWGDPIRDTSRINAASFVLGAVDFGVAYFLDVDQGDKDRFSVFPENKACQGIRGEEKWEDCGDLLGQGWVWNVP